MLEGFRSGVTNKLRLGYDQLKEINPGLVYCSLSGYGQSGPYRDLSGHDINYTALSGLLGLPGEEGGPPAMSGVPLSDLIGGMMAVIGILAAVRSRDVTGKGQFVDVAMMDSIVSLLGMYMVQYGATGISPGRGKEHISGILPRYNLYKTKDSRYMALGALEDKFWQAFCNAVGRPELALGNSEGTGLRCSLPEKFKKFLARKRKLSGWNF